MSVSGLLVMVPRRIRPSPAASQPTHGSCSAPAWRTKGTLAWGDRPNDEPLNLEDVVGMPKGFAPTPGDKDRAAIHTPERIAARAEPLRQRIALCRKVGMTTILHTLMLKDQLTMEKCEPLAEAIAMFDVDLPGFSGRISCPAGSSCKKEGWTITSE
jgi:hypothetical protein